MKNQLCIAVVQKTRDPFDREENTRQGLSYMEQAKAMGADLALFPECWITGYEFPEFDDEMPVEEIEKTEAFQSWAASAMKEDDPHLLAFRQKAKELQMGVVITGYTQGKRRPRNTAFLIGRDGEILLRYHKVHTCDFASERMLESGDEFFVAEFDGVKIGIMICYDREYPESARVLMMKGAEIILVPNDCSEMVHRVNVLSTRAYENMTGVVMANPPGRRKGRSCAFSPIIWRDDVEQDNRIFVAGEEEGIFPAVYDLADLRHYREHEMMGNTFRKVKAYGPLLDAAIQPPFVRLHQRSEK